jgi:hypothetical protein
MEIGQLIKLRAYGGEELIRQVVRTAKDVVVVCRPDEYEKANKEKRVPVSVGFHIKDVITEKIK